VPQNEKERVAWLERSAEHGNVEAQYEMGMALRYGRGVIQDYARAATWLERAALGGHGLAQFELGLMYRGDAGIETDNVKAYTWLNLAAAQGIIGADAAREIVLRKLSPAEIAEAQGQARRLSETQRNPAAAAR
jgi:TPR repeat protein